MAKFVENRFYKMLQILLARKI